MKTTRAPLAASALSEEFDTQAAVFEVVEKLQARSGPAFRPDMLCVTASFHHRARLAQAIERFRRDLHPAHLLAATFTGVVGEGRELEQSAGLSVLALTLPNVVIRPFWFDAEDGPPAVWSSALIRERVSLPPDEGAGNGVLPHRGILMLTDPFSLNAEHACTAINQAAGPHGARIFGGVASGAHLAGLNVLAVDRRVSHGGAVGVSIFGDVRLDGFTSQGSRPIGPRLTLTKAHDHTIETIGGVPALEAARTMIDELPDETRKLVGQGVLIGFAIDAGKRHLGRGDFLVRVVQSVDAADGSFTVNHSVRTGMTVQFQVQDAATAADDLSMCLEAEQLREEVIAALLFTCEARGRALFGPTHHDASMLARRLKDPPLAGCHCSGEFGLAGNATQLHTHSASAVLFRAVH